MCRFYDRFDRVEEVALFKLTLFPALCRVFRKSWRNTAPPGEDGGEDAPQCPGGSGRCRLYRPVLCRRSPSAGDRWDLGGRHRIRPCGRKAGRTMSCNEQGGLNGPISSVDDERLYVAGDNIHYIPAGASNRYAGDGELRAKRCYCPIFVSITGKANLKSINRSFMGDDQPWRAVRVAGRFPD